MMKLLTPEELGEILKISVNTIYQWTSKRRVPFIKVGKLIRFPEDEILHWLENHKSAPQKELIRRLMENGKTLSKR